ncbi:AsmA-like C-terminal region-containing protein [Croceimicrobium hydrocarbonivorans]|uniref:Uncharacterized protein n=1 Tax=Croceimicrobium hydrocarbonivorans TaxID=2761580 RepID=A0A7H0VI76_9FLAO|nr:AsmA-like C-terminal region-containing protein [Croceimicrobium hydrocarbonivorans]QNR25424.1 hypothetical protein H4K34_06180 [Croceimicrobium hydrocarbonivorans]
MLKGILRIFAWITGIFLLIFGLTFALLYFRQDQIRDLVFASLNENLETEIQVKEAGISLRKFPKAAIRLQAVHAAGSRDLSDTLFYAEDLFVEFRVWDMFDSEIPISSISLENGQLNLVKNGALNNWSIFKEGSGDSQAAVKLESIKLKNIRYRYQDEESSLKGFISDLLAAGRFGGSDWNLDLQIQSQAESFKSGKEHYLQNPIIVDGAFSLKGGEELELVASQLQLATIENLKASLKTGQASVFSLEHQELDLQQIKNIYAILNMEWPENLDLDGKAALKAQFIIRENTDLRTEVFAQLKGLNIESGDFQFADLEAQLEYYRQGAFDRLEIRELKSLSEQVQIRGTIRQILKPQLKLNISIDEDQDFWAKLLPEDWQMKSGHCKVDLNIDGSFPDWNSLGGIALANAKIDGNIDWEKLEMEIGDNFAFESKLGRSSFLKQNLQIDTLLIKHGDSDLSLKGRLIHPLRFISDSLTTLGAEALIVSQHFNLQDFLSEGSSSEDDSLSLDWKKRLDLRTRVHLHEFKFRNFDAKELKGQVYINRRAISGEGISLLADEGRYQGKFVLRTPEDSSFHFQAELKATNVLVASVFKSFDNFSQETITADNLEGRLSLEAKIEAPISPDLQLDPNGLEVLSEMQIDQGHLRNYEPLQALSRFAEVDELKDVSFNTLKNTITIANGEIRIPDMAIASNVLNLNLSGTHNFENEIEYIITMRLGDVLFAKRDKTSGNKEFEEHLSVSKRDDDHRIPIRISGTVDDPQIGIDGEAMGSSVKESLRKQGEEIKGLFKKKEEKKEKDTGLKFEWDEG